MSQFRRKILHQTECKNPTPLTDNAQLEASPDLIHVGSSLLGFRGKLLALFRFFENRFLELARDYEAEEHEYPVLLPRAVLEELSYFTHFPNQVLFCSHLPEDLPTLEEFAHYAADHGGTPAEHFHELFQKPDLVMKPAVCLPCYRIFRDQTLAPEKTKVVTMQNHVFRREESQTFSPDRLWDFHVRDLVLMGAYKPLLKLRSEIMERAVDWCRELDLSATVELANDPFFLEENRDKIMYQRLGEVKYELILETPHRGGGVAAGSFNLHRGFYASVYNIRLTGGSLAETACMGFGLERWLYGFLCQKGLNPADWPDPVREFVEDYPC